MFEQIKSSDDSITFDAPTICFILGWVPLIIAWVEYNTVLTEWIVQTYFVTVMVFINYPRLYERKNLRKSWFWKALVLTLVVVHPIILSLIWFVDFSTKTKWHEAATMLSICAASGALEFVVLERILNSFRPATELPETSPHRH